MLKQTSSVTVANPPAPTGSQGRWSALPWLLYVCVALCAVGPYLNTFDVPFVWDDHVLVEHNPNIRELGDAARVWGEMWSAAYFEKSGEWYYRPLIHISYILDWARGNGNPAAFHQTSLLAHLLASLCVLAIARRMLSPAPALAAGVLFAVHPAHAEAVTWISARPDVVSSLFSYGTFICFLIGRERRVLWPWLPCALGLLACGLLSKESTLMVPAIAGLWELGRRRLSPRDDPRGTGASREAIIWHAALWGMAAGFVILRFVVIGDHPRGTPPLLGGSRWIGFLSSVPIVLRYTHLMVWPVELSLFRNTEIASGLLDLRVLAAAGGLASITACAFACRRRAPVVLGCWLVFLLLLLPVMNIVPMTVAEGERRLYMPSAAFCIGVAAAGSAWGKALQLNRRQRRVAAVLVAGIVCVFGLRLTARNDEFHSEIGLYQQAIRVGDKNPDAHYNYALLAQQLGDYELAEREFQEAARLLPTFSQAYAGWAECLHLQGRTREAVPVILRAVALEPDSWETYFDAGVILGATGLVEPAADAFGRAAQLAPDLARPRVAWIRTLMHLERIEEARAACAAMPRPPDDSAYYGQTLARLCRELS